jgi:DNA-binding CsgD family transcriptional regulator
MPNAPAVVAEACLRLLSKLGEGRGVVVVLEDAHWADVDTMEVVGLLADEIAPNPIVLLVTVRTDTAGPATRVLEELVASRGAERILLGRLKHDQILELARSALEGEPLEPSLAELLQQSAFGVPFLAEEIISAFGQGLRSSGPSRATARQAVASAIPASYREIVLGRLSALDESARRVVAAAAILGQPFEPRLVGRIAGIDDPALTAAIRAAVAELLIEESLAGHLGAFAFRHALAREAVLTAFLPGERAALAVAGAEAIEELYPGLPGDWCELAAELRDEGGDHLGAVRLLHESAVRAVRRGALASAETRLLRAEVLAGEDEMAWAAADELLARVYLLTGQMDRLVALVDRVVGVYRHYQALGGRLLRPARVAQLHMLIARSGLAAGDATRARLALDDARRFVTAGDPESAELRVVEARLALLDAADDLDERIARAEEAVAGAKWVDLRLEVYEIAALGALRSGIPDRARRYLDDMARVADQAGLVAFQIRALRELGRLDLAAGGSPDRALAARRLAIDTGALVELVCIEGILARAAMDQGQLHEASVALQRALDLAARFAPAELTALHLADAERHAVAGNVTDMERALAAAIDSAPAADTTLRALVAGDVRSSAALLRGDSAAALAAYEEAIEALDDSANPAMRRWRAWCELLTGRIEDVREPTTDPVILGLEAMARSVALGRQGRSDEARRTLYEAASAMPAGWRRERARLVVAEAALVDGWGDPGAWAASAASWFDAAGLQRAVAMTRPLMRRAGVPVPRRGRGEAAVPPDLRPFGITSREMDVLLLAGTGLPNRGIGERLFLSPRTVESHIASLLRKTGAGSRGELVALAARRSAEEGVRSRTVS